MKYLWLFVLVCSFSAFSQDDSGAWEEPMATSDPLMDSELTPPGMSDEEFIQAQEEPYPGAPDYSPVSSEPEEYSAEDQ